MLNEFKQKGYTHLKKVIAKDVVDEVRFRAIQLSKKYKPLFGKPRHNGSGQFWKGFELASTLDPNLWKFYTAPFMLDIAKKYLEIDTPYLFNDQIVVKFPEEDFYFGEHSDNQLGPDPEGALKGDFKTINCCWVLTNMNEDNGCLFIQNKPIIAEAGDIIIIEGNTLHKSEHNTSDKIRALYACVYSSHAIGKNFNKGYYHEKFETK